MLIQLLIDKTREESWVPRPGRLGEDLHLQDVAKFEPVETNLNDIDEKDVSIHQSSSSGEVNPRLATQKAGPLNHSRWLTLAIRLLQLYTRTSEPSDGLRKIVRFIQQLYGPSWFAIKKSPKFTNGPALLFQQMMYIKSQPEDVQEDVKPVVQRNAFMTEPGIMLCSMLESPSSSIRNKSLDVIRKLREKPPKKPRAKVLKEFAPTRILSCSGLPPPGLTSLTGRRLHQRWRGSKKAPVHTLRSRGQENQTTI